MYALKVICLDPVCAMSQLLLLLLRVKGLGRVVPPVYLFWPISRSQITRIWKFRINFTLKIAVTMTTSVRSKTVIYVLQNKHGAPVVSVMNSSLRARARKCVSLYSNNMTFNQITWSAVSAMN